MWDFVAQKTSNLFCKFFYIESAFPMVYKCYTSILYLLSINFWAYKYYILIIFWTHLFTWIFIYLTVILADALNHKYGIYYSKILNLGLVFAKCKKKNVAHFVSSIV